MFIKENIMLAVAGLKSNKMRALLTMLGIIIGISSVIGIVSVGNALTASVTSNVASMGANNITINVAQRSTTSTQKNGSGGGGGGLRLPGGGGGAPGGGGKNGSSSSSTKKTPADSDLLSMEKINALRENYSDKINAISISKNSGSGKVKDGSLFANISVVGTNDGYQDVKNITLSEGRFISEQDMTDVKKVAVVSDKLVAKMFSEDIDPIGQEVKVYVSGTIKSYTIIGVYKYESNGGNSSESDDNLSTDLYLPITVVKTSSLDKNYQSITIKSNDNVDISAFTDELSAYLATVYENNKDFEGKASNMQSMLSSLTTMMSTLKIAIAVIAGISLLVGGIGVMNIMLVSVTERTREIGTRKALGAKSTHIQMQFIVESMIICAIGGLIGIVLGILIGAIGATILKQSPSISIPIILISFTFSMVIGVFFGYYPAKKAANLDPIEALRYE
ncbi:ABC transporter permease [Clostridium gelidum]|uniref:ABC transporter permease n=1 Tax=Clostridium gelidum TaxID=704125 RepID=A0ABM7TAM1_9CLOT|nr:ABC transporter permease [Clostridium gelidum]BCZ46054.1 ABC transporter permease [Clostridium gelidum]